MRARSAAERRFVGAARERPGLKLHVRYMALAIFDACRNWERRRGLISQTPRNAAHREPTLMHGLIYLIGLIVVIMAVLSFLGLR
jgi:hypothetical protein